MLILKYAYIVKYNHIVYNDYCDNNYYVYLAVILIDLFIVRHDDIYLAANSLPTYAFNIAANNVVMAILYLSDIGLNQHIRYLSCY